MIQHDVDTAMKRGEKVCVEFSSLETIKFTTLLLRVLWYQVVVYYHTKDLIKDLEQSVDS